MPKKFLPLIYIGIIIAVLAFSAVTRQQPEIVLETPVGEMPDFGMTFPQNYREEFTQYLVVDRVDNTVRHIFASPDAISAISAGDDIPFGAQFVIETWDARTDFFGNVQRNRNGHLVPDTMRPNIHVMEKRADWTVEQLPSPVGVIDWNFASFDADTMRPSIENRNDCLTCHDGGAFRRDFIFSRNVLNAFVANDQTQYVFCSLPNRGNCIR